MAIALVACYHVFAGRVSGGVDVFLTLSGFFLILSLQSRLRSMSTTGPLTTGREIVQAWRRIGRRLVPTAAVVLAAVIAATILFLPRGRWDETARQALASLLYAENWYLIANEFDYEAADMAVSPVQHFWSLSVQGQIFIAAPVLVLGVAWLCSSRSRAVQMRAVFVVLTLVASASFLYAVVAVRRDQPAAYYDTFARTWELLAGGLLALALPHLRGAIAAVPGVVRTVLGYVAIAAIITGGILIDGGSRFPGPATWWPVGATLALIALGSAPSARGVDRFLAVAPLRWLGGHAYAWYLWHWPALVLYLGVRRRNDIPWYVGVVILGISLALAAVTKSIVEEPLRRGRTRSARPGTRWVLAWSTVVLGAIAVVSSGIALPANVERDREQEWLLAAESAHYPGALALADPGSTAAVSYQPLPSAHLARGDSPRDLPRPCLSGTERRRLIRCVLHDSPGDRTVVLVGSSHSVALIPALVEIAHERGFDLVGYLTSGCPWGGRDEFLNPNYPHQDLVNDCMRWSGEVTEQLIAEQPDLVVSTATRPGRRVGTSGDVVPQSYLTVWDEATRAGLELVMVRDNPWFAYNVAECVERYLPLGVETANTECGVDRSAVLSDPAPMGDVDMAGVSFIDLSDSICRRDRCQAVEGNILVYRDTNHLTASFSRTLASEFDRQLGAVTGWWNSVTTDQS